MSLNVNAKAWTPGGAKPAATPAVAPVAQQQPQQQNYNNNNRGNFQPQHQQQMVPQFNPMAPQFTPGNFQPQGNYGVPLHQMQPYFDPVYGLMIPPLIPQLMVQPNGELVPVMVPNPYYNPPQFAFLNANGVPQGYDPNYDPNANGQNDNQEQVPVNEDGSSEESTQEGVSVIADSVVDESVAEVTAGVEAVSIATTPLPALIPATAAPVASPAVTKKDVAAPVSVVKTAAPVPEVVVVVTAPVVEVKTAPVSGSAAAAIASYGVATKALSMEPPSSSSSSDKHVYDKTTLIGLFKKNSYACTKNISDVYGSYAKTERDPIGFYFLNANLMTRSASSHNNLAGHGSSSNLKGHNSSAELQRGAKVQGGDHTPHDRDNRGGNTPGGRGGRGGRGHHKQDPGLRDRLEKAERDDELFYSDPSAPVSTDGPQYTSRFKSEESDLEKVVRESNFILNKLSVTKFEKLSDEFMATGLLESAETIKRAVDLIVLKAQMEEHFCFMYADLCKKITEQGITVLAVDTTAESKPAEVDEEGAAAEKGPRTLGEVFRQLLLERCQSEFEFDRVEALETIRSSVDTTPEERTERELGLKKRYTGTMRFIGELYVKDLIRANVMSGCLEILLKSDEEGELVCMCKLFQTIGLQIETYYVEKGKGTKNKTKKQKYLDTVSDYFITVDRLAVDHSSSRVRYMLKDLGDLRDNQWVPRREADKVVNLEESRGGQNTQQTPSTPSGSGDARSFHAPPVDEWSTVGKGGRGASSNNLTAMNTNLNIKPPAAGGQSMGAKFMASRGGNTPGGAMQRTQSNNQMAPGVSPKGSNAPNVTWDKKGKGPAASGPSAASTAGGLKRTILPRETVVKETAPVVAAAVSAVPVESGPFDKESAHWKKIKSTVEEFYHNKLVEEVEIVLKDLSVPQSHMQDIIKYLIIGALEKKNEDRKALASLINQLVKTKQMLRSEHVSAGIALFLNEYDDVVIDVPLAGTYASSIVGDLIVGDVVSLSLFNGLGDEHNFPMSTRAVDFIAQVLHTVTQGSSSENAQTLFTASGIQLLPLVIAPPKTTPEAYLAELSTKYNVPFIVIV